MKKLLFGLIVALMAGSLISWNWAKTQFSPVNKADVVECLNMETDVVGLFRNSEMMSSVTFHKGVNIVCLLLCLDE